MKQSNITLSLIIAGACCFNYLFWQEQFALNALLFDVFLLTSLFLLYNGTRKKAVQFLFVLHVISVVALLVWNSIVSKFAFAGTLLLLIAFVEYAHRSAWYAGASMFFNFLYFIAGLYRLLINRPLPGTKKFNLKRLFRFALLPLSISFAFLVIYGNANVVFGNMLQQIGDRIGHLLDNLSRLFYFPRMIFLGFGFYVTGSLLLRVRTSRPEERERFARNNMARVRRKRMDIRNSLAYDLTVGIMGKLAKGNLALKNEYRTGLFCLLLLNALLLVVNLIDIRYLWVGFQYNPSIDLYTMVHEGTDLLIASIILAMLVLMAFFRGNLNFYKENKWLKWAAYCWLVQNTVLVISVLLRDYYYIREFGLAYRRIGVLFFLVLVMAGLITMMIKIKYAKTNYYLFRMNAWCVTVLLTLASLVPWDAYIAKYDIDHRSSAPLNLPYLLSLTDHVLPVLKENLPALRLREKELNDSSILLGRCSGCIDSILAAREHAFLEEQQTYSWLSWNYTDAREIKYLQAAAPAVSFAR